MPRLELEVGILLCSCALISVLVFSFDKKPEEGKIKLYEQHLGRDEGEDDDLQEQSDPYYVTKDEDIIDGYPIKENEFWQKVRISI